MSKIAMMSTGEEVLHGDITDTNAAWMSGRFFEAGLPLCKRSTVGDEHKSLADEMMMLALNHDVLIVNGGLGPTTDDLTAAVAAEISEQSLVLFPEWLKVLEAFYLSRNRPMPKSNIKQAMLPEKATIIDNPIGTACGFKMQIHDCWCYFTPGVPSEFKRMVDEQIIPDLLAMGDSSTAQTCHKIYTFGSSESVISDTLDDLPLPEGFTLGYRSYQPFIEIKVFGPRQAEESHYKVVEQIVERMQAHVTSIDQPMLAALDDAVASKELLRIAIAEQSTAGHLCAMLSDYPHSHAAIHTGWVLHHDITGHLDDADPLAPALALAEATREKSAVDIAVVTGPVDSQEVTIALATPQGEWALRLKLLRKYNGNELRIFISTVACDMLLRYLTDRPVIAEYSSTERLAYIQVEA